MNIMLCSLPPVNQLAAKINIPGVQTMTQRDVINTAVNRLLYDHGHTITDSSAVCLLWSHIINAEQMSGEQLSRNRLVSVCVGKLTQILMTEVRSIHLTVVEVRKPFDQTTVGWNFEYICCYQFENRIAVEHIPFFIDRKGTFKYNDNNLVSTHFIWTKHAIERIYNRYIPSSDHGSPGILVQVIKDMSVDAIKFDMEYGHITRKNGMNILMVRSGHCPYENTDGLLYITTYIERGLYIGDQEQLVKMLEHIQKEREVNASNYDIYLHGNNKLKICSKKLKAKQIDVYLPNQRGLYHALRKTRSSNHMMD